MYVHKCVQVYVCASAAGPFMFSKWDHFGNRYFRKVISTGYDLFGIIDRGYYCLDLYAVCLCASVQVYECMQIRSGA